MKQARRSSMRAFSLIELLICVAIIVIVIVMILTGIEVRHRTIVKATVIQFLSNLDACTKIAIMSPKEKAALVFRPTDGPYSYYYLSSDIQGKKTIYLPAGVKIVNTNGLIDQHSLRIGPSGAILDEFGYVRKSPNPGIITFTSPDTNRVYTVEIDPETGRVEYQ